MYQDFSDREPAGSSREDALLKLEFAALLTAQLLGLAFAVFTLVRPLLDN